MKIVQSQAQVQQLSQKQLLGIKLLQMSTLELESYLQELSQENPLIELSSLSCEADSPQDDILVQQLRWLEETDRQNSYFQEFTSEELDPLARAGNSGGLDETLVRFVSRQLERKQVEPATARLVCYLAGCLNENGYLDFSLDDLARSSGIALASLQDALELLRSLEPAGIGACSLSQCLELQLLRVGEQGLPLSIVQHHLEDLGRWRYPAIACALSVSVDEVKHAAAVIRSLEPRPGLIFQRQEPVNYITPDIFIEEHHGHFVAIPYCRNREPFHINSYYLDLIDTSTDPSVVHYLRDKLHQAETVRWTLQQRQSTLQQCAQVIAERQADFFHGDITALHPIRLCDIAQQLDLHESTVCRAIREKFLQCSLGVFPLSHFICRNATSSSTCENFSSASATAMILQCIQNEDKHHPLSDKQICEKLSQAGCTISRRTITKHREQLNIPNTTGRRI